MPGIRPMPVYPTRSNTRPYHQTEMAHAAAQGASTNAPLKKIPAAAMAIAAAWNKP
jgi:hypothetical protein